MGKAFYQARKDGLMGIIRKQLSDGTYLISREEDKSFRYHWHVAPDGTILSIKDGGKHFYNRGRVRQNIKELIGVDMQTGWSPATITPGFDDSVPDDI
ncbi:hypothetical protein [Pseudooceanicola atlanticus]|uniref:hypothetical protein n=1 Tax=Pseudooceanicola atlanticus TaxID=1461694 RepID=UPI0023556B45|nr:hypothetical protein [Pseudooceanicola atlanticus]